MDVSVVAFDASVDARQRQSRALAHLLGGEERLENPAARFAVHSAARIANANLHVRSGDYLAGVVGARLFVEGDILRRERKHPSVGHGVAGVHAQIYQCVFDLRRIGQDRRRIGLKIQLDIDSLVDAVAKEGY